MFAESYAVLMPGSWPEPFGLVAIEALACGTPVVARRVGALPEIIREGVDGFFGDDVTELAFMVGRVGDLDRKAISASVLERFSAGRMADGYEAIYRRMLGEGSDDREAEAAGDDAVAETPRPIRPMSATAAAVASATVIRKRPATLSAVAEALRAPFAPRPLAGTPEGGRHMRPLLALLILAATLAVGACSTSSSSTAPGLESTSPVVTSPDTSSPVTSPEASPSA